MKKIVSVILSVVLVLVMSFSVFASSAKDSNKYKELSKEKKIKILTQRGCPLSSVENAPDQLLDELLKDEGEFVKVTKKTCNFNEVNEQLEVITEEDITGGEVSASVMPTSDFVLTLYVQRITERAGDNFKFVAHGDWNTPPYWLLTDMAALAWSDSFTLYYDSCTSYGIDGNWNSFTPTCPRVNVNVEAGVSHEIPLAKGMVGQYYDQVAKVYLNPGQTGSANVTADYAHRMVGIGSISAGFNVGGDGSVQIGFSVSPTLSWDKAIPPYSAFNY